MTAPIPRHKIPAQRRLEILRAVRSGSTHVTDLAQSFGAARRLAEQAPRVVVTLGPDGALELDRGRLVEAHAPPHRVVDTTGAGDLFMAAYAWADLNMVAGAATIDVLLEEGARLGLELPAWHQPVKIEEEAR